jgi:hypothetical protein
MLLPAGAFCSWAVAARLLCIAIFPALCGGAAQAQKGKPAAVFASKSAETKRREIYIALTRAEKQANDEAARKYPRPDGTKANYSMSRDFAQISRQTDMMNELGPRYSRLVMKRYGITDEQRIDIEVEGITKHWPMPKGR